MRILCTLMLLFAATTSGLFAQCTGSEPLISQVAEGSGNNKSVEIYNPTGAPLDLSLYELVRIANGGGVASGTTIALTGTIASGDVYVISNNQAESAILNISDQQSGTISHNGNDSYVLRLVSDGTIVDSYGDADSSANFGVNMNMERILSGPCPYDTDPIDAFDPSAYNSASYTTGLPPGLGDPIGVLPVEFTAFDATLRNEKVALTWSTASEKNNAGFEVERSADGRRFESIGFERGEGDSYENVDYTYTDYSPLAGLSYYRLKQVDFDGVYDYSKMVAVRNMTGSITVSPSTTSSYVTVSTTADAEGKVHMYNSVGMLMQTTTTANGIAQLDLADLQSGIYFVQIEVNGKVYTEKVVRD